MLIAMRNAMMAGGGLSAKSYVQDGLVAMWDGIENAGWGQHDASATTWKNLTGNGYDLTLTAGTYWTDTGCATNSRSSGRLAYRSANLTNVLTIECVFDMRSEVNNNQGRCLVKVRNSRSVMCLGLMAIRSRGEPSVSMDTTALVLISQFSASVVYAELAANDNIYFNGAKTDTISASGNWNLSTELSIGGNGSATTAIVGKCHSVRLYSRALTADEIAANYAVDKARFNLP